MAEPPGRLLDPGAGPSALGAGTAAVIALQRPEGQRGDVLLLHTSAQNFPVTPGAFQTIHPGGFDSAWAAELTLPSLAAATNATDTNSPAITQPHQTRQLR